MEQTLGSNERFGLASVARQRTFAASGSAQTDAAQIGASATLNIVTGATGANGVRLPKSRAPRQIIVYPSAATNALLVYPPAGGTINNGSTNDSFSATARTPYIFMSLPDGITWIAK